MKIDNRLLLVLVIILIVISITGTYIILSSMYVTPVTAPKENTGVVGVTILSEKDTIPSSTGSGLVGLTVLGGETETE